jgi:hypothetical protein
MFKFSRNSGYNRLEENQSGFFPVDLLTDSSLKTAIERYLWQK